MITYSCRETQVAIDPGNSAMAQAWQMAAADLSIEFVSPYTFRDAADGEFTCAGLLVNFGGPKGTIIHSQHDFESDEQWALADAAETALGFYGSGLSPYHYERYERELFVEALNDWGWFGPEGEHPSWFTGGFGVHGESADQSASPSPAQFEVQQHEVIAKFEMFSDNSRQLMRLANHEAKWHLHPRIDTPHLLTALAKQRKAIAGAFLQQQGLTARSVRRVVRRKMAFQWSLHFRAKLPMTRRVQDVVAHAVRHAVAENHESIGTGGILLAMLRHDEVTADLLETLAVDRHGLERVMGQYLHRLMVEKPGQPLHFDLTV